MLLTQLVCHAVHAGNYTTEVAVTHPRTHRAQRNTTSTPHESTTSTRNSDVANSTSFDFQKTNKTSATTKALTTGKTVSLNTSGLVSMATERRPLSGQQVSDHVTSSLAYWSPTSDSSSHVTNSTSGSVTPEKTGNNGFTSHGVPGNNVTLRLLGETPTGNVTEGSRSVWENWTTSVEADTLVYTADNSVSNSSDHVTAGAMTSLNHTTAPFHTLNSGE